MAIRSMERVDFGPSNSAAFYESLTVEDGLTSDIIKIPTNSNITSIGADIGGAGTGIIYFTLDSHAVIDASNETYQAWDGLSQINEGVTGFKVVSSSGQVIGKVTVKTSKS